MPEFASFHGASHLPEYQLTWDNTELPLRRLLHLLQNILERPDLASSVQHVSLLSSAAPWTHLEKCDMDWDRESNSSGFTSVVKRTIAIIRKAQLPQLEEWILALRGGSFYPLWLFSSRWLRILSRLFWIIPLPGRVGEYLGRMVEHAILSPNGHLPVFDRLERVGYGGNVPMPEDIGLS